MVNVLQLLLSHDTCIFSVSCANLLRDIHVVYLNATSGDGYANKNNVLFNATVVMMISVVGVWCMLLHCVQYAAIYRLRTEHFIPVFLGFVVLILVHTLSIRFTSVRGE